MSRESSPATAAGGVAHGKLSVRSLPSQARRVVAGSCVLAQEPAGYAQGRCAARKPAQAPPLVREPQPGRGVRLPCGRPLRTVGLPVARSPMRRGVAGDDAVVGGQDEVSPRDRQSMSSSAVISSRMSSPRLTAGSSGVQDRRFPDQGAGDRHPLLPAAGRFCGRCRARSLSPIASSARAVRPKEIPGPRNGSPRTWSTAAVRTPRPAARSRRAPAARQAASSSRYQHRAGHRSRRGAPAPPALPAERTSDPPDPMRRRRPAVDLHVEPAFCPGSAGRASAVVMVQIRMSRASPECELPVPCCGRDT